MGVRGEATGFLVGGLWWFRYRMDSSKRYTVEVTQYGGLISWLKCTGIVPP